MFSSKSALHVAAEKGSVECLSVLLKHPSVTDVNLKDKVYLNMSMNVVCERRLRTWLQVSIGCNIRCI